MGETTRTYEDTSYKLDITNDLLTSRAGLLSIADLMNSLGLSDYIDT